MAFTYIFKRVEKKYLLSPEQYEYIIGKLTPHMSEDRFGRTCIRNIYFDNTGDELIETSLEKPAYKEKLRLRSYGTPSSDTTVFFEIKKKYNGIVYKRRISMTLDEAYSYIESGELPDHLVGNIPVEIDYMIRRYRLFPKAFISYDRLALVGNNDPELRVTFDSNITSRYSDIRLESESAGEQLLPEGYHLMEIKIPGAMPLWLAHVLSEKSIFPQSFSKFGVAHIRKKQELMYRRNIYSADLRKVSGF